jgi:hypothetical protein
MRARIASAARERLVLPLGPSDDHLHITRAQRPRREVDRDAAAGDVDVPDDRVRHAIRIETLVQDFAERHEDGIDR